MAATMILVNLAGEIGLLLWGRHMATSGVLRAYGTDVRRWLGRSLHHPMMAILAGMLVTALLQSSTATSLMATSFASSGVIDLASGLSVMLGANIGTTLIVQVLSFNLSVIAPLLILVGVIVFRRGDGDTQIEELGRILIGLGLMLLALSMLARTTAAVEAAPLAKAVLRSLIGQPVLAIVLAAAFTWACPSGWFPRLSLECRCDAIDSLSGYITCYRATASSSASAWSQCGRDIAGLLRSTFCCSASFAAG